MEKTKDDPKSSFFRNYQNAHQSNLPSNHPNRFKIIKFPIASSTECQMNLIIADFYLATFAANSITLQFLLQRFHMQPEILRRCQNEIDDVVGQSRLPNLDDRIKYENKHNLFTSIRKDIKSLFDVLNHPFPKRKKNRISTNFYFF